MNQIIPLTGGHTDEDIIVYFKNSGVVCLGDMISPGSFPVVKLNNGGSANILLGNVGKLVSLFPESVTFIVGHGMEMTLQEVHSYHNMLQGTIEIIQAAMKRNMTVEEMKRAKILKDWSAFNDPENEETTAETWIETVFRSSVKRTDK
jgi:glyoxylase-like metal-dependent hydrolase (beta-lactamase superfamily II)